MNWMFWPTVTLAAALFWLGQFLQSRLRSHSSRIAFAVIASILALPGIAYAAYYTKRLGEPIWLYELRAFPGSELAAAGVGLAAGYLHRLRHSHPTLKRQMRGPIIPAAVFLLLAIPHLKPVLRPLNHDLLRNNWREGVCIQSTPSTCGPASAATLCRNAGRQVEEAELARESLTSASGTENWYLARALQRRRLSVRFLKQNRTEDSMPTPTIAGVRLAQGAGHFIALIGRDGTNYIVGDPLEGREVLSLPELKSRYQFTGFFMEVR
jgi:hypothetical protein